VTDDEKKALIIAFCIGGGIPSLGFIILLLVGA
jgi:hypothetical protein